MFYRIATCISCPWSERPESSYWGKKREKKGQSVFFPSAGVAETSLAAKSPRLVSAREVRLPQTAAYVSRRSSARRCANRAAFYAAPKIGSDRDQRGTVA